MADKLWMKGAVKHPGAMTRAAKREGVSNSQYITEHEHGGGHAGQMARLAKVFRKQRRK